MQVPELQWLSRVLIAILVAGVAFGDSPAPSKFRAELETTPGFTDELVRQIRSAALRELAPLPVAERGPIVEKLVASLSEKELRDAVAPLWEQSFSESELGYIVTLKKSDFGRRLFGSSDKIRERQISFTEKKITAGYNQVTGMTYPPPAPPPPTWLTKLIWRYYPEANPCAEP